MREQSMNQPPAVAVLMAVYYGVDPEGLGAALASVAAQTLPPAEVLVVADGHLTPRLEAVIASYGRERLPVRLLRLPEHRGAGPARQFALDAADSEWVAIADADDVSEPERLEKQIAYAAREGLDAVGAAMTEVGDAAVPGQVRLAPLTHEAILHRVRINNPFNHPTLCFRLETARRAGGYRAVPFLEDYEFVVRLLALGDVRVANLPDPLVTYRLDRSTLRRRSSRGVNRSEIHLQRELRDSGFISPGRAIGNLIVRAGYRALPMTWRPWLHRRLLSAHHSVRKSTMRIGS